MVERRRELMITTRRETPKGAAERNAATLGSRRASHHRAQIQGSRASRTVVAMEARGWSHIAKQKKINK